MTKSGLFKDERDTVRRRVRHRDGKLLKGGIGLTTGLGWSDSEDEDAPSPLTRKLSSTTVGRKSLPTSIRSSPSTSSSLSRNFNEMGLEEERRPRASLPTELFRQPSMSSLSKPRTSLSSLRSMPSSSRLSAPRAHHEEMPKTPRSAPPNSSTSHVSALPAARRLERSASDMDAVYKSDPAPRAQRASSASSRPGSLRSSLSRSTSSTSAGQGSGSTQLRSMAPPTSWAGGRPTEVPRPLRLPQSHGASGVDGTRPLSDATDRSRQSTGSSVSAGSARGRDSAHVPSATAQRGVTSPRSSVGPDGKAKPRTGTGMVYRTTPSGAAARPTMMRAPSSTKLRAAYQKEVGIAT